MHDDMKRPLGILRPLLVATFAILLLLMALVHSANAQGSPEKPRGRVIPLSDPKKPVFVEVTMLSGGITVLGYDGTEVRVVATVDGEEHDDENEEGDSNPRARGLKRIRNRSAGLSIEEHDNRIHIQTSSWRNSVDVELRVPRRTSLELGTVNDGDIVVRGVEGEIEAQNTNGAITVEDVSGSVLAEAVNGDIVVRLNRVEPDKAMSFVSMNGDLDVTLPPDMRANLRLSTENGEIFTDFDLDLVDAGWEDDADVASDKAQAERDRAQAERDRARAERDRARAEADRARIEGEPTPKPSPHPTPGVTPVTPKTPKPPKPPRAPREPKAVSHFESGMVGKLNGGGPPVHFESFNGNIYIRKRK